MSTAILPTPATIPTSLSASPPAPPLVAQPKSVIEAAVALLPVMQPGQRILLDGISWADYVWFDLQRDELRPHAKLTYDHGRLEIDMASSFFHDRHSRKLCIVVMVISAIFGVATIAGGGTTFHREDLESGLEPDECFYIQNAEVVCKLTDIDLSIHPPPDLAIEVDRTNSSIPKETIYYQLGVPELWRFDDSAVTFLVRQSDGTYRDQAASRSFPILTSDELSRFVWDNYTLDDGAYLLRAMTWAKTLLPKS